MIALATAGPGRSANPRRRGAARVAAVGVALALGLIPGVRLARGSSGAPEGDEILKLADSGHFNEAEERARGLLSARVADQGAEAPGTAEAIGILVDVLRRAGRSSEPETVDLARRAVAILEKARGPDDRAVADALCRLGAVARDRGEFAEARGFYDRAVDIDRRSTSGDNLDLSRALSGLAVTRVSLSQAPDALPLLQEALAIQIAALGKDDAEVGTTLLKLGSAQRHAGEYLPAKATYEKALALLTRLEGSDSPVVARCLVNLANVLRETGELDLAMAHYRRALGIFESTYSSEHPLVSATLLSLAIVLVDIGDVAGARPLEERALEIDRKTKGPNHPDVTDDMTGLSEILFQEGDLEGALAIAKESLAIQEPVLGPDHLSVAKTTSAMANALREMGRYPEAMELYERTQRIWEQVYGDGDAYLARILADIARLREATGDLEGARSLYERARTIWGAVLGQESPFLATLGSELAGILIRQGDQDGAASLLAQILPALKRSYGADSLPYAWALERQARVDWLRADAPKALGGSLDARIISRQRFQEAERGLSEREALAFETRRLVPLDLAMSVLAAGGRSPDMVARVWDDVVRSRAMVLDEIAGRHRGVVAAENPELAALAATLERSRAAFARLTVRGPDPEHPERYAAVVRRARENMEQAERDLARQGGASRFDDGSRHQDLARVARRLPPGSALVAYVLYGRLGPEREGQAVPSYMALVLPSGSARPAAVPLGSAATIDALTDAWGREAMQNPQADASGPVIAEQRYRLAAGRLREAIWDPVSAKLGGARQVFIVPDAQIHRVSFATLATGADAYLVETGPTIHYLSSERDLLRAPGPERPGAGVLALADPQYDAGTTVAASSTPVYRGPHPGCESFRTVTFDALPESRKEAATLQSLLQSRAQASGAPGNDLLLLVGAEATEGAFKQEASGKRILHLATHGFLLDQSCGSSLEKGAAPGGPLLLSGLAFAGANHRNEIPADAKAEDGILTAEEIASLDLSGVSWVVLSACRSGVGGVVNGEGILGLRRAFETAGAATLIMALWEVEDAAARAWMEHLYEGRFSGLTTPDAVRQASRRLVEDQRRQGATTHPFYWGAFVAAGDWR
jgi:CHAT domain-containing protein/tetratricopeptide (TPR) repeat protein